ncbi:MAG TPA: DUF1810 domain-containing protein [Gaiellales bacterium]|nr:DUF1810 domain-containing protein [Gaiellales bacterium]
MTGTDDPYDLARFVQAQEGVYDQAAAELRRGRKTSHWMWFVFPQIAGLGRSPAAQHFAISSLDEARGYLGHPLLGPRLREAAEILADEIPRRPGLTAESVMGSIDALKLRSSMTLFHLACDGSEAVFQRVLDRYFGGELDLATLERV